MLPTEGEWRLQERFKSSLQQVLSKPKKGKRKIIASIHWDELPDQEAKANALIIVNAKKNLHYLQSLVEILRGKATRGQVELTASEKKLVLEATYSINDSLDEGAKVAREANQQQP